MFFVMSIFAALPLVFALLDKKRLVRLFGFLSIFFVFAFFILPLNLIYYYGNVEYFGLPVIFSAKDFSFSLICLALFCCGFASLDLFRIAKTSSNSEKIYSAISQLDKAQKSSIKLDIIVMAAVGVICIYFYYSSRYFVSLAERQEKTDADQTMGLLIICLYYLGSITLIDLVEKRKYVLGSMHFSSLVFMALNFVGRMQVILVFTIIFMRFIKSVRMFAILFILGMIVFLPLILNGKQIIFTLFDDPYSLIYIGQYYTADIDVNVLMNNFAHPLISLYYADVTINSIGYRFFWDVPHGILFYLRFFGLDMGQSLTYFNTETIVFLKESIIPPGYLAFGYIQAGYFGVFIMGIFFRYTGVIVEKVNSISQYSSLTRDFFWAFTAANTFYAGEVRVLVLTYLLPVLIYVGYLKFKRQRVPQI
jgi:hypothetical protein